MRKNEKHLKFIRSLACVKCRRIPSEAAHLRKGTDGGMGLKPSDCFTVPLCHDCHSEQHRIGEESFWGDMEKAKRLALALFDASGNWREACLLIVRFGQ